MAADSNHDMQTIKEIISTIKKTVIESEFMDTRTIEELQKNLDLLKEYLSHFDNPVDFLTAVNDFMDSLNYLVIMSDNHLQNNSTLKAHAAKLEQEFDNFKQKTELFEEF